MPNRTITNCALAAALRGYADLPDSDKHIKSGAQIGVGFIQNRYKKEFVKFLLESGALSIGSFRLKSGRESPYFINTGLFDDGYKIAKLGEFYAERAIDATGGNFDIVFGPPYKGIPLAVAVSVALANRGLNKGWASYRKEGKEHGEASGYSGTKEQLQKELVLGHAITNSSRILLVDDVLTTGEAKEEALDVLDSVADNTRVVAGLISVDRQELDERGRDAVAEFRQKTGVQFFAIATLSDIVEVRLEAGGLEPQQKNVFRNYISRWGTDEAKRRLVSQLY